MTLLLPADETTHIVARYSAFLGKRVEVQYRAGDILLPASGLLVADSGRSIFLEQSIEQRGRHSHFRWEIPYQYLVRIEEEPDSGTSLNPATSAESSTRSSESASPAKPAKEPRSSAASAGLGGSSGLLPLAQRPKTA